MDNSTLLMQMFGNATICRKLYEYYEKNRYAFSKTPAVGNAFTFFYVAVLTVGAIGNLLVMVAVAKNPAIRGPRNFFITNLALSDFLLCTITVPFNMKLVLFMFWDLSELACRMVATANGINVFVSTMSITAIGLDRFMVIIFPTKTLHQRTFIAAVFVAVWLLSIVFASPFFFVTSTDPIHATLHNAFNHCGPELNQYIMCHENDKLWNQMPFGRRTYAIACAIFQYLLPIFALSFVYMQIGHKMQGRMAMGSARSAIDERRQKLQQRISRRKALLTALVVIFAISWLPLNIYNFLTEFRVVKHNLAAFTFCHIAGMTSACANPILYGVFNENFRTEFKRIFQQLGILTAARAIRTFALKLLCCGRNIEQQQREQDESNLTVLRTRHSHIEHSVSPCRLLVPGKQMNGQKMVEFSTVMNGDTIAENEEIMNGDTIAENEEIML